MSLGKIEDEPASLPHSTPTKLAYSFVGVEAVRVMWNLAAAYMPGASVSWWNGDTHLPFFFCQMEVASTLSACFLPPHVASCFAVYIMTTVSLSSHM